MKDKTLLWWIAGGIAVFAAKVLLDERRDDARLDLITRIVSKLNEHTDDLHEVFMWLGQEKKEETTH